MVVCCLTLGIARYLMAEILCCGAIKIVYWPVGWVFLSESRPLRSSQDGDGGPILPLRLCVVLRWYAVALIGLCVVGLGLCVALHLQLRVVSQLGLCVVSHLGMCLASQLRLLVDFHLELCVVLWLGLGLCVVSRLGLCVVS